MGVTNHNRKYLVLKIFPVAAHFEYDPFGRTIVASGSNAGDFSHRFSTKPVDPATGLYYYGYRWLDSDTGRWINRDPIEENGGVCIYGHIFNATLNKIDYLGLDDEAHSFVVEQGADGLEIIVSGAADLDKIKQAGYSSMLKVTLEARQSIGKAACFSGGTYQFADNKLEKAIQDAVNQGKPSRFPVGAQFAAQSVASLSAAVDIWEFSVWVKGGAMQKYNKVHKSAVGLCKAKNRCACELFCDAVDEFIHALPASAIGGVNAILQNRMNCLFDCNIYYQN